MIKKENRAFTLIEVLLVIAILAILAAIVIVAINPAKQIGESQNAQRRSDLRAILDAVHQYSIDNNGELPANIPVATAGQTCLAQGNMICQTAIADCGSAVNIRVLTNDEKYLISAPADPVAASEGNTEYLILQTEGGRIAVCAPYAYGDIDITLTR